MPKLNMKLSKNGVDFIDNDRLETLARKKCEDKGRIREIIAKSLDKKALTLEETADLLNSSKDLTDEIFDAAHKLKETVYGNRIVLFAPLYVANKCINNCSYCGFKCSNKDVLRRTLTHDELAQEVVALEKHGHKRLILVYGEHPDYDAEFIASTVRKVYETKSEPHGEIRRVNINAAPLDVEGYQIVKQAGIGTYQIFQETYHKETYAKCHPANTRKGDFLWRLDGLSRAMEGGCDDLGIGALFGLYDWRFETLGLVQHALFLEQKYGVGPHTISFPRLQPASGVDFDEKYYVNDDDFIKLIAILRLAVPYTGLILTARENQQVRHAAMGFGVSQIDAGSRIEIGGYSANAAQQEIDKEQFTLGDVRSLDEVMLELIENDFVPSFCTSCYRLGRTGEHFMEFAIPGFIKRYCTPNALCTLQEYLCDYASEATRAAGEKLIAKEVQMIGDPKMSQQVTKRLEQIKKESQRDLYF
ncbi:MAG: [FeFe] hydrogenase H-cluster radical SAM maturase HydG [Sedimentisphaeraceae bacterium JB056]